MARLRAALAEAEERAQVAEAALAEAGAELRHLRGYFDTLAKLVGRDVMGFRNEVLASMAEQTRAHEAQIREFQSLLAREWSRRLAPKPARRHG